MDDAAGNRDVIDYMSFAGTVVGMILAILAIVYSYLANASQKDDSEALRSQINSLNDAINRAQVSGNQFSNQLERLDDIRESISVAIANSAATLEASGRLEGLLGNLNEVREKPTETSLNVPGFDEDSAARYFARRALPRQVVLYYLAANLDDESEGMAAFRAELIKLIAGDKHPGRIPLYDGEVWGYFWIFYDLEAISGNRKILLLRALLERAAKLPDSIYTESGEELEAVKRAVEVVAQRIRSDLG